MIILRHAALALGVLPVKWRALGGRCGGFLYSLIPSRNREIAKKQLEVIAKIPVNTKLIGMTFASAGETLMESINLAPLLDHYQDYVIADWAQMDDIISRKKGVVILSAHTGNWDLLAACSVKRGLKVSVVGAAAKNSQFQQILSDVRAGYGVTTIWRSGTAAAKHILSILKRGEAVAALIDQDTRVINCFAPFFGRAAATPSTLIELGQKCGAIIVAPFIIRERTNHYRITIHEFDPKLSVEQIAAEYSLLLEYLIRQHPGQWVWFHKRWRTLPDGRHLSSKEYLESLAI